MRCAAGASPSHSEILARPMCCGEPGFAAHQGSDDPARCGVLAAGDRSAPLSTAGGDRSFGSRRCLAARRRPDGAGRCRCACGEAGRRAAGLGEADAALSCQSTRFIGGPAAQHWRMRGRLRRGKIANSQTIDLMTENNPCKISCSAHGMLGNAVLRFLRTSIDTTW